MISQAIAKPILQNHEYLELQIQRRVGSRVRDFRLALRPGGVILQGRAATYHAKQLAQHAAMEIAGLPILANDIEVC
ncbi:hypothetical protein AYO44_17495 [Planctomycetaceae bacterium SCGC AG-212-F19]|nr:hypothetical protein AYO44_17495 [Planctomycetaceae bacterium SCGC AG-212-F19]